ncbi:MAG: IclR family transcriptional regulator [Thermodesulfobacteriota bacterium]
MRDKNYIKSFAKGIAIMELLGGAPEPLSLTQIANHLVTTKTTAQRFLNTLILLGYVRRVDGKKYLLGNKVLSLAFRFLHSEGVYSHARPYLDDLSNELDRSVSMGVLDDTEVLVIFRKERTRFYPFAVYVGSKTPSYCTAMGKVLLASLSDEDMKALLERANLFKVTSKTVVSKTEILKEAKRTRERGYAIVDQEFSLDLYAIGVPLLNHSNEVVASVSISLKVRDKDDPKLVERAKASLFAAGQQISQGLGYDGPYPAITR